MKKKDTFNDHTGTSRNHIPDIEIIDLERNKSPQKPESQEEKTQVPNETDEFPQDSAEADKQDTAPKKGIRSFLNIHVLLLAVFIIFVVAIVWKFSNWGILIDQSEIDSDHSVGYLDVLDYFLPLVDEEGNIVPTGEVDNIVVFGNAPFADDRDSEDNLANMIADATGATVHNCSISNSYLASQWPYFDANEVPMDAYCFYWLVVLATTDANSHYYSEAAAVLGDSIPPEAQEVYETLTTLDFNEVDVIAVMYDASDYLMGHGMYDDANPTNIQQFTGNMEAGIELLQQQLPHIRIIVMSPTYAYAINEEGEYVSSDIQRYGQDTLSTYVIKQSDSCASRSVSFVDNLYGTITEANAKEYLTDNLHLNVKGREKIAARFVTALEYFND